MTEEIILNKIGQAVMEAVETWEGSDKKIAKRLGRSKTILSILRARNFTHFSLYELLHLADKAGVGVELSCFCAIPGTEPAGEYTYTLRATDWMELTHVIEGCTDHTDEWYTPRFAEIVKGIQSALSWTDWVTLALSFKVDQWIKVLEETKQETRKEEIVECLPSKELSKSVGKYLSLNT